MNPIGREIVDGLQQFLKDLEDGKPIKADTVLRAPLARILKAYGLTVSLSEGRRIVSQGAVRINGELKTDLSEEVFLRDGDVIEVGRNKRVEVRFGGLTPRTRVSQIGPAHFEEES